MTDVAVELSCRKTLSFLSFQMVQIVRRTRVSNPGLASLVTSLQLVIHQSASEMVFYGGSNL